MTSYATGARRLAFAAAIGFAGCALAQQDYPNRAIRYIVPHAPGGSTTFTARLVGQRLTEAWGQQVGIIDRISAEVAKLVAMPETREKLDAQGFVPHYNNPEQTAALLKSEIVKYAKIIKAANIKSE